MMKIKGNNNEPIIEFKDNNEVVFSDNKVKKDFLENFDPKDEQIIKNIKISD